MHLKNNDTYYINQLPAKFSEMKDKKITNIYASPFSCALFVASGVNLFVFGNFVNHRVGESAYKFYFDTFDNTYFDNWAPNNHYLQSEKIRKKVSYFWLYSKI